MATLSSKTLIGRIAKGFEWLGYHVSPVGLRIGCSCAPALGLGAGLAQLPLACRP
jgi:hypothetical protein